MVRAIDWVFEILPPEREDIPDNDDVVLATTFIQSVVLNAFGCLDNLAWIWVYETGFKTNEGKDIDAKFVGLGESYWYLRRKFTKPFQKYLRSQKQWIIHLTGFRDALAHRIPLYIPPYIISGDSIAEYERLGGEAIKAGSIEEYDRIRGEQKKLGHFRPWMTHSPLEGAPNIVFHYQLLQDFATIDEFACEMLDELDRIEKQQMASGYEKSSEYGGPAPRLQWWIIGIAVAAAIIALCLHFAG